MMSTASRKWSCFSVAWRFFWKELLSQFPTMKEKRFLNVSLQAFILSIPCFICLFPRVWAFTVVIITCKSNTIQAARGKKWIRNFFPEYESICLTRGEFDFKKGWLNSPETVLQYLPFEMTKSCLIEKDRNAVRPLRHLRALSPPSFR